MAISTDPTSVYMPDRVALLSIFMCVQVSLLIGLDHVILFEIIINSHYIAAVLQISLYTVPLLIKVIVNIFALDVPVAKTPADLNPVPHVKFQLVVPDVVIITTIICPAI
jgi:hypothetical protein